MARNKLPKSEKKVLLMSVYVHPILNNELTKIEISKLINNLQSQSLKKCADEVLKNTK